MSSNPYWKDAANGDNFQLIKKIFDRKKNSHALPYIQESKGRFCAKSQGGPRKKNHAREQNPNAAGSDY